jgi:hypothetical protein
LKRVAVVQVGGVEAATIRARRIKQITIEKKSKALCVDVVCLAVG